MKQKFRWAEDQDEFIVENPYYTNEQLAQYLGRTASAVAKRKAFLRRAGRLKPNTQKRKSPYDIGSRTMLAKTCTKCGLLLDSSWFYFSKSQQRWRSDCVRCHQDYLKKREYKPQRDWEAKQDPTRLASRRKQAQLKLQAITIPYATRKGLPWTAEDEKVLLDPTKTILEKAVELKRTYFSTCFAVSDRRAPSLVGRGHPIVVGGIWVIELADGQTFQTREELTPEKIAEYDEFGWPIEESMTGVAS